MRKKLVLQKFRNELTKKGLHIYLQPRSDMYGGEEVPSYDSRLEFISGFTGSAGFAIITIEKALLFVDGRYTLQAKLQLDSNWTVMELSSDSWINWILENTKLGEKIGYDPWLIKAKDFTLLSSKINQKHSLIPDKNNLVDRIWEKRPKIFQPPPKKWNKKYFTLSVENKIEQLKSKMKIKGLDALVITQPNQLCWLLNIRGDDLKYTPLFLGFLVLKKNGEISIFSRNNNKLIDNTYKNYLYSDLIPFIKKFKNKNIAINLNYCPSIIAESIKLRNNKIIEDFTYLQDISTIKNKLDRKFIRGCHLRDGASLVKFLYWIDKQIVSKKITEYQASIKLMEFRAKDKNFISESFPSILATGENGAIIHYRPEKHNSRIILKDKLLLIDSGGQYYDGTTDITRTIAFKDQPQEVKDIYTYVLKAHIALARLKFKPKTRGNEIDAIVRSKLWEKGLDYNHGTGHGVGFCLGVHEFPPVISKNISSALEVGQLISNEPGYYLENGFGIRLENLVLVQDSKVSNSQYLEFETVSFCHFENKLINKKLLEINEIDWLNDYHYDVYSNLEVYLNKNEKKWLKQKTVNI